MKEIPQDILFDNVRRLLLEGHDVKLCAEGRSMQPYLRGDGSETLVVSPVSSLDELQAGQIVLFPHRNNYVFHRIVREKAGKLFIQGDGNCSGTEEIARQEVIGIIHSIIRRNGKQVSTQTFWTGVYWRIWYRLRPVRRYPLFIYHRLKN